VDRAKDWQERAQRVTRNGGLPQVADGGWRARWATIRAAPRALSLALAILLIFAVFAHRLHHLQFVRGEYYRSRADDQRLNEVSIPAPRGIIYARDGTPLVRNVPSFSVTIVPAYVPEEEQQAEEMLTRLADLLDMPYSTPTGTGVRQMVDAALAEGAYYRPLELKSDVGRETALIVAQERLTLPGVVVELHAVRDYPFGPLVSQLVGYPLAIPERLAAEYEEQGYDPATDRVGIAGVEATYEQVLRGQDGEQVVEDDVLGRVIQVVEERAVPVPGGNVVLTVDLELQQAAEEALRRGLEEVDSRRGVLIAMQPQTGEILALVSLPTYDNNLFSHGISSGELEELNEDTHLPQVNHAIGDSVQPGSLFKVVVAAAGLQEGAIDAETEYTCPGTIVVPNKYFPNDPGEAESFHCWNLSGHGSLNVVDAIAHSCNIFFYKLGGGFEGFDEDEEAVEGIGARVIADYAEAFGLGSATGIELTGEISGTVPRPDWKRRTIGETWSTGNSYLFSIGEEYLSVSPLQMLNAVNVVANGGALYRPAVVHHTTDAAGNTVSEFEPFVLDTLDFEPETWSLIQQGMEGAVAYGSARLTQIEGVRIAGKTGTAQYCDNIALEQGICLPGYQQPEHAWFAGFAPVGDPEISIIVFLYNGGEGSTNAVPVAHELFQYYFSREGVIPE
jgi:penicillin-binding protein 2